MKKRITLKGIGQVIKESFSFFGQDKIPKLSGSLAYSTVFSIAPFLIVMISLFGIFLGREAMEGKIYEQLNSFFGSGTAAQLQEIIKNASLSGKSKTAAIVGSIILFIGATAIFSEIQDSINLIWRLKAKPKKGKGWLKLITNRLLSFSMIVTLGFLLLVSLIINGLMDVFIDHLTNKFPHTQVIFVYIFNLIFTFFITSFLFGIIFKILPDARIKWKDIRAGAIATALLFMAGRFVIGYYLGHSKMSSAYGAAGSIIVILLWVYYSAIILYFGAAFTRVYAVVRGSPIYPNNYAVWIEQVEVESKKPLDQEVQEAETLKEMPIQNK